jgi:Ring finger domain
MTEPRIRIRTGTSHRNPIINRRERFIWRSAIEPAWYPEPIISYFLINRRMNMINYREISDILETVLQNSMNDTELKRDESIKIDFRVEKYKINDQKQCPVCQENYSENQDVALLNCNHIFHIKCISDWGKYKQECPLCREKINVISSSEKRRHNEI